MTFDNKKQNVFKANSSQKQKKINNINDDIQRNNKTKSAFLRLFKMIVDNDGEVILIV